MWEHQTQLIKVPMQEYENKITECVKTCLDTLLIELDPETVTAIAENITKD